jgi:hypothetical protein
VKETNNELTKLLAGAETLAAEHDKVRTAIADALLAEDRARRSWLTTKGTGGTAESNFILHRIQEDELERARGDLFDANAAYEQAQLAVEGLRGALIDFKAEAALRNAASAFQPFKQPLTEAAINTATESIRKAHAAFMQALTEGRAAEAASGKLFVDRLVATPLPQDGRPLPSLPVGCVPIGLPGPMPASATSDPALKRLLEVENRLAGCLGAIQGERTRQTRERWRTARAAGNGISRVAKHPWPEASPARPIKQPTIDPDREDAQLSGVLPDGDVPVGMVSPFERF